MRHISGLRRIGAAAFVAVALAVAIAWPLSARAQEGNADWKADWERTLAAAKREGALIISAPSGAIWREQLAAFQKDYPEIKLSLSTFASRDFWPRVVKEREAGQYLWDLRVGGADTPSYNLKNQGALLPVRPLFILPEVTGDANWHGGLDALFLDREKQFMPMFVATATQSDYYNKVKIPDASDLTVQNLILPKWAGKISLADPRAGSSLNTLTVLDYLYGDDFIVKLITGQKPVITKEPRQQLDWLASGRYPIAFGLPSAAFLEYGQRGGRIEDFGTIPGLKLWSPGVGGVQVPNRNPHPNATKIYVNWLFSREVQARIMPAVQLNSRRTDVAPGAPELAIDWSRFNEYVGTQVEELQSYSVRVSEILRRTAP